MSCRGLFVYRNSAEFNLFISRGSVQALELVESMSVSVQLGSIPSSRLACLLGSLWAKDHLVLS